jgi:rod shape determining protein RodA
MRIRSIAGLDLGILIPAVALSLLGLLVIYSATGGEGLGRGPFVKQLIWLGLGAIVAGVVVVTPPKTFHAFAIVIYAVSVLLLLAVLFLPAAGGGARRWIHLGPVNFQPSEFAKFALVMVLARVMSDRRFRRERLQGLLLPVLLTAVPFALVLVEPDLGTSLVFGGILISMLFWSGVKGIYLVLLVTPLISVAAAFHWISWLVFFAILLVSIYAFRVRLSDAAYLLVVNPAVGIATPLIWNSLKTYQQKRILGFLNPSLDPWGTGWHIMQSKIAIGSGGLLGKGILHGTQKKLEFLPQRHTDFVYSVIGEELGLLGCVAVLLVFYVMIRRTISLAKTCNNRFSSLACIGLISYITFQTVVNVGMTLGIMPVAGIPLPFVSYGGSSMLFTLVSVGLLLSIARHKFEY